MTQINTKQQLRDMLMVRDHISKQEASYMINKTQQIIDDCLDTCTLDDVEDILLDQLGIELDYIFLFLC